MLILTVIRIYSIYLLLYFKEFEYLLQIFKQTALTAILNLKNWQVGFTKENAGIAYITATMAGAAQSIHQLSQFFSDYINYS